MGDVFKYLSELFTAAGLLWAVAVGGAFIAGSGEKAYPNEGGKHPAVVTLVAGIVSLITPVLLFFHAFWAIAVQNPISSVDILEIIQAALGHAAVIALLVVMAVLVIVPALVGVLVAAIAPPLGKLLYAIAPYLNIAVFVLTVYVTHDNVLAVMNAAMHRPG
jgi:hypothetical protein